MKDDITAYSKLIDQYIKAMKYGKQPASLYEPIRYLMGLGGKRLRPMLTLMSYSLFRDDVKSIVPYAVAVETFHNFTLMHDDIMDKAPLRRGHPTVHEKWNISTALLSGDVMLIKVYDMFRALDPEKFQTVIKAFNQCAIDVCEGQQWDMEFETTSQVTEAHYLRMIQLKTAVLLGFSLELGAILAEATIHDRKALYEFGVNIGTGFQLKDDLLDAYADPKKFGKQVGGDIIVNKKTYLLIKALEKANIKQKKELTYWLNERKFKKQEKIQSVKAIYDALGIPSLTERKINFYFTKGFDQLNTLSSSQAKERLIAYTKNLIERQS